MLGDKDPAAVARQLDADVDEWLLASTDGERGISAAELEQRMGSMHGALHRFADMPAAMRAAQERANPGDRVVVLGSFHVVGPALDALGL
jgi:dihydrofolate synthase/folylpolyglutamate synthase